MSTSQRHTWTRRSLISVCIFSMRSSTPLSISGLALCSTLLLMFILSVCAFCCMALYLATSFAIVVINAAGLKKSENNIGNANLTLVAYLAVAISVKACLAVLQESA